MSKFQIYIIKNDINDKVYIGQTTQPLPKRFNEHFGYHCSAIGEAMRNIGKSHFSIYLLDDTANNLDELLEKEIYYVQKYNSVKNGYNRCIPCKTKGKIHSRIFLSTGVKGDNAERIRLYSKTTGIPLSKLFDKAISMYLESVRK